MLTLVGAKIPWSGYTKSMRFPKPVTPLTVQVDEVDVCSSMNVYCNPITLDWPGSVTNGHDFSLANSTNGDRVRFVEAGSRMD